MPSFNEMISRTGAEAVKEVVAHKIVHVLGCDHKI